MVAELSDPRHGDRRPARRSPGSPTRVFALLAASLLALPVHPASGGDCATGYGASPDLLRGELFAPSITFLEPFVLLEYEGRLAEILGSTDAGDLVASCGLLVEDSLEQAGSVPSTSAARAEGRARVRDGSIGLGVGGLIPSAEAGDPFVEAESIATVRLREVFDVDSDQPDRPAWIELASSHSGTWSVFRPDGDELDFDVLRLLRIEARHLPDYPDAANQVDPGPALVLDQLDGDAALVEFASRSLRFDLARASGRLVVDLLYRATGFARANTCYTPPGRSYTCYPGAGFAYDGQLTLAIAGTSPGSAFTARSGMTYAVPETPSSLQAAIAIGALLLASRRTAPG